MGYGDGWMDIDDSGYRQLRFQTIIARKDHKCCYCNRIITRGERYNRHVFVEEGTFCSQAEHLGGGICILEDFI